MYYSYSHLLAYGQTMWKSPSPTNSRKSQKGTENPISNLKKGTVFSVKGQADVGETVSLRNTRQDWNLLVAVC